MPRWDGKRGFLLCCGCCACLAVMTLCFVHVPLGEEREALAAEGQALRQETLELENFLNAHRDFPAYSEGLLRQQEQAEAALPKELEQGKCIALLQQKAAAHQVMLQSVTPGEVRREGELQCLPLDVSLQCGYFSLLDYLAALQEGRFLRLEGGTVRRGKEGLACQLHLAAFALPDAE